MMNSAGHGLAGIADMHLIPVRYFSWERPDPNLNKISRPMSIC